MDTSLPNNLTMQFDGSLKKVHSHSHGEVSKSKGLNSGSSEQQARLDAERLQEWRLRVKQMRAKHNH